MITRAGSSAVAPAFSWGSSAWVSMNGALTLMSITLSKPISGNSPSGAPHAAPALLTRMSICDSRSVSAIHERGETVGGRQIGRDRDALAVLGQLGGGRVAGLGLAGGDVGAHAVGHEPRGDHEPDAPGSPGDDGDLAVESEEVGKCERRAGIRHAGSMAHDNSSDQVLEVRGRGIVRRGRGSAPLATGDVSDGQIRLRIDSFAVTANNVSYAGAGDMLGYWDFFPADDDPQTWGRVPAMGWAEIVESRNADLPVGGRYYGWFPMARSVDVHRHGHRRRLPRRRRPPPGPRPDLPRLHLAPPRPVVRRLTRRRGSSRRAPGAVPDRLPRRRVLRRLWWHSTHPADDGAPYFGAQQVVVLSASSKTAIGFAQRAAQARRARASSASRRLANVEFVRSLGFYDSVLTYDEIDDATRTHGRQRGHRHGGQPDVLAAVHRRLGDRSSYSMMIGKSHHDAVPPPDAPAPARPGAAVLLRADWTSSVASPRGAPSSTGAARPRPSHEFIEGSRVVDDHRLARRPRSRRRPARHGRRSTPARSRRASAS